MKVVINDMHGGFSLSYEGMLHYAMLKGLELYPEKDNPNDYWRYWLVPKDQRPTDLTTAQWCALPHEGRVAYNEQWDKLRLSERDMPRNDPALVQTVEELGDKAAGRYSSLKIVEIPDDVKWEIDEYDGLEWVAEVHRKWS